MGAAPKFSVSISINPIQNNSKMLKLTLTLMLTVNGFSDSANFDADANAHCEWTLRVNFNTGNQ